jgi:predicted GNAT family N-acyltransferase
MPAGIEIREADWEQDAAAIREVRTRVFVEEQEVPPEEEWDGLDDDAVHLLAVDADGHALGTARLLPGGQIGRMAVIAELRGTGVGRALLDRAVEAAVDRGAREVFLNAQTHALGFYEAGGFTAVGERFMEAGIPHLRMERSLGIAFDPPDTSGLEVVKAATEREPYPLPALDSLSAGVEPLQGDGTLRDAVLDLCSHARREVLILAPELDPKLFDDADLEELLSAFVRRHERARLTILIHDSRRMVREGHRLLELARRLSTSIRIRMVHPEMRDREDTLVLVDRTGVLQIPKTGTARGFVDRNDAPLAEQWAKLFQRLEERSLEDPDLRTMTI